jgi:hypothetical protein
MGFGLFEKQEIKHRVGWLNNTRGVSAEAIKNYKKGSNGLGGKMSAEDLRHQLAQDDRYFRDVDSKDLEKALGSKAKKKKRSWFSF